MALLHNQFDEGIVISMDANVPRTFMNVPQVKTNFRYGASFGASPQVTYELGPCGPREVCEWIAKDKPQ